MDIELIIDGMLRHQDETAGADQSDNILTLQELDAQIPTELQPHEQESHLCWRNPKIICNVFDHFCCAEIDCEFK